MSSVVFSNTVFSNTDGIFCGLNLLRCGFDKALGALTNIKTFHKKSPDEIALTKRNIGKYQI
jgi:hypothetical protein